MRKTGENQELKNSGKETEGKDLSTDRRPTP
jgi:hypothetical protein